MSPSILLTTSHSQPTDYFETSALKDLKITLKTTRKRVSPCMCYLCLRGHLLSSPLSPAIFKLQGIMAQVP